MNYRILWATLFVASATAIAAVSGWTHWREQLKLRALLARSITPAGQPYVDCGARSAPLVLLVLGQSNAGNHGATGTGGSAVTVAVSGGCVRTTDPLPGATGQGGSIWSRLPNALDRHGYKRPLVLGLLALDGLHAEPWVAGSSPIRARLSEVIQDLRAQGLVPNFVLWQQGEADARQGTPPAQWQASLQRLADVLLQEGIHAPILLAKSTRCRSEPDAALRAAVSTLASTEPRFASGPDTDSLTGVAMRYDGCHFSAAGLAAAADLWANTLVANLHGSGAPYR